MNVTPELFDVWKEEKFQGRTKDEMLAAGALINVGLVRQMSEATMRTKLCEAVGEMPPNEPVVPVAPVAKIAGRFDPKPQLLPGGRWGGKRWSVSVQSPDINSASPQNYFQIAWEGQTFLYGYGIKLSLPHPHYVILKGCTVTEVRQKNRKNENGDTESVDNYDVPRSRYNITEYGVVPGTEDLPESLQQYWQLQAAKHDNFKGVNRRELTRIREDLYGPVKQGFYKDLTDNDILYDILVFLFGDEAIAA